MTLRLLQPKEFLVEAAELVRMQLPPELRDARVMGPRGFLIKLHYGQPKVHYEVWIQRRAGKIEVGLHFEDSAEVNGRYLKALTSRFEGLVRSLGPEVSPEHWAGSWTRVHQVIRFTDLDEDVLMLVANRMAHLVIVLEPAVREISSAFS